MSKKLIVSVVAIVLLTLSACSTTKEETMTSPTNTPLPTAEPTPEARTDYPLNAIIIVGNEFGNTYFDMKTELEAQGFTVTTVGVGSKDLLSSCPNHENQKVTPDLNIKDITEENINDYSVVFIPAGKHHKTIGSYRDVKRVLNLCKENYLYISAVCAGNIVLSEIDGLIEGTKIACSTITKKPVQNAGGICAYDNVVVDGYFVTGKQGGGNTASGHKAAPTKEVAEELRKLVDSH